MKKRLVTIGGSIIWAWIIFSAVYTAATGDALWSNVHYQTGGRVVAGISAIVLVGLGLDMWRMERRWNRERAIRNFNNTMRDVHADTHDRGAG